ncbi:MAG: L,D-transpeptidase [Eubacterium sp.]|nr:L,D-transpeptidase [Eubacterium sp.]
MSDRRENIHVKRNAKEHAIARGVKGNGIEESDRKENAEEKETIRSEKGKSRKRKAAHRRQVRLEFITLSVSAVLVLILVIVSIAAAGKRSGKSAKEAVASVSGSSESLVSVSVPDGPYVEPTYTKEEIETANGAPAISSDYSKVIRVNLAQCVATVYETSEDASTETPVKAFVCSPAREGYTTPQGEFYLGEWYEWGYLVDGTFGQYSYRIIDNISNNIMFHSVPYTAQDKSTLENGEYNKLGSPASMGCMRMPVRDVRWLCENCGFGTKVVIYSDAEEALPLGKPEADFIPPEDTEISGWDPTDPDPSNPWRDYDFTLSIPNVVRVEAGKTVSVEEWEKSLADEVENVSSTSGDTSTTVSSTSSAEANNRTDAANYGTDAERNSTASSSTASNSSAEEISFNTSALAPYAQAKDSLGHDITRYLTDTGGYDLNKPGVYQTTVTLKAGPVTASKDVTISVS